MSETHAPTARTRVVREAHRGVYERAAAYEILDEGFICHVGFMVDGQPMVIPTGYARAGDGDRARSELAALAVLDPVLAARVESEITARGR